MDSSSIALAQDFFEVGGPVVVILVSLSVIAVTVILLKLWQFRVLNKRDLTVVNKAIRLHRTSHSRDALTLLQDSSNPVAQTVAVAIKGSQNTALSENLVREEVVRYATEQIEQLRIHFRTLEVISTISPLLGLFGTVLGMIDAFRQLSLAGSQVDPSVLSGGIWVALLTTAVGLAVAIPVVVVLNFLERIVERTSHAMENAVTQVFTIDLTSVTDTNNESIPIATANAGVSH